MTFGLLIFNFYQIQLDRLLQHSDSSPGTASGTSESSLLKNLTEDMPDWVLNAEEKCDEITKGNVVQLLPDGGYGSFQVILNVPGEESPICIVKLMKVRYSLIDM